jgi:hypothetical protein
MFGVFFMIEILAATLSPKCEKRYFKSKETYDQNRLHVLNNFCIYFFYLLEKKEIFSPLLFCIIGKKRGGPMWILSKSCTPLKRSLKKVRLRKLLLN